MARQARSIRIEGEVAYVPLTRGFEAVIDAADVPLVEGKNWYAFVTKYGHVYAARAQTIDGKQAMVLMHRRLMDCPPGKEVDHEDGDGLNNRRYNLRIATHQQNMANQVVTRRNKLGIKGVWERKGRYRACIEVNGKTYHLGTFATPEEAAAAYRGAAKVLHGDFANAA